MSAVGGKSGKKASSLMSTQGTSRAANMWEQRAAAANAEKEVAAKPLYARPEREKVIQERLAVVGANADQAEEQSSNNNVNEMMAE
jgi:hypothetical protein